MTFQPDSPRFPRAPTAVSCRSLYVGVDIRIFKDIIINSIRSVVGRGWGRVSQYNIAVY